MLLFRRAAVLILPSGGLRAHAFGGDPIMICQTIMILSWLNLKREESVDVMLITAIILPPGAFVSGRLLQRLAPAT